MKGEWARTVHDEEKGCLDKNKERRQKEVSLSIDVNAKWRHYKIIFPFEFITNIAETKLILCFFDEHRKQINFIQLPSINTPPHWRKKIHCVFFFFFFFCSLFFPLQYFLYTRPFYCFCSMKLNSFVKGYFSRLPYFLTILSAGLENCIILVPKLTCRAEWEPLEK